MSVSATALVKDEESSTPERVQALQQATVYAEQGEKVRASSAALIHDGIRDVMLRVAALWDLMGERCLVVDALRAAAETRAPHAGNDSMKQPIDRSCTIATVGKGVGAHPMDAQ
jgi:hypothetical protein